MSGLPLRDPVTEAAEEYLANVLVMRFTPEAREAVFARLSERGSLQFRGIAAGLKDDQLQLARQNTVRFLSEAERLARENGDNAVDENSVQIAWIKFCPGLFPFC